MVLFKGLLMQDIIGRSKNKAYKYTLNSFLKTVSFSKTSIYGASI
jgi:hypothetical protein